MNEKVCVLIRNSPKFVPKCQIDNEPVDVGSGNDVAPNKRQGIMRTNAYMRNYEEIS